MPSNTQWHTKITLFKSYILSTVSYASEIWCPSKTDLTRLELLQFRVLKWTFPGSNYKDGLSKAKMLPISLQIQLWSLILLNRLLNGFYSNLPILSHISSTIANSGAYNTKFWCIQHPVVWKAYVRSSESQEDTNDTRFLLTSAKTFELLPCKHESGLIQKLR